MKRIFLDTNIMLDLAMHREHFDSALAIAKGAYDGRFEMCASTLSFANIALFFARNHKIRSAECLICLQRTFPCCR